MTVIQELDALVVMEIKYREKAVFDATFRDALNLCAEFCSYHREILEYNCGAFLDREVSGSRAAELSHSILEPDRVSAIFGR